MRSVTSRVPPGVPSFTWRYRLLEEPVAALMNTWSPTATTLVTSGDWVPLAR